MRPVAIALAAMALAGCGSDDESSPPAAPEATQTRFLEGGRDAFEAYVAKQKGQPVVVNKWASWCGPCRAEFPHFGSQARKREGEVVFVGVNSQDEDRAALEFLADNPVPFRHFTDPELEVAASFNGVQAFPTTAFYDRKGELAYVNHGPYAQEADLAEDIDKYAR